MRRFIHYGVRKGSISREQWANIVDLMAKFNHQVPSGTGVSLELTAVYPNWRMGAEAPTAIAYESAILRQRGIPENTILERLEEKNILTQRRGGYRSGWLMSGYSEVTDSADVPIKFIRAASTRAPHLEFEIIDEGDRTGHATWKFRDGMMIRSIEERMVFQ